MRKQGLDGLWSIFIGGSSPTKYRLQPLRPCGPPPRVRTSPHGHFAAQARQNRRAVMFFLLKPKQAFRFEEEEQRNEAAFAAPAEANDMKLVTTKGRHESAELLPTK